MRNTFFFKNTSHFYLYSDFNEMLKTSFLGEGYLKWIIHLYEYIPIFLL